VVNLGSGGGAARKNAGDDHEALGSDFASMSGMSGGDAGVLRASADDGGDASFDKVADAFHALLVSEEGPVAHGATVDDAAHALVDEGLCGFDKGAVIDVSLCVAGSHECRNAAFENGTSGHVKIMTE